MQTVEDGVHGERFNIEEKVSLCLCESEASALKNYWIVK